MHTSITIEMLRRDCAQTVAQSALLLLVFASMTSSHSPHQHTYGEGDKPTGFHDSRVVQDQEHINEHLDGVAKMNASQMTQEELEFHYFKLHDFDNNTMLDGLEIFKALTHLLPYDDQDDVQKVDPRGKSAEQVTDERRKAEIVYYTDIVDNVLKEDDIDDDGYLTYAEYVLARRREEMREELRSKDL
ncbi:hypothetical protein CAPTEDRAFT_159406 [Capitella teleta]|uniref:EF-hand domain-containing protein n=1 Tax=Capitella teleta TaxID=283909 RepID=R7T7N1_CAPTE|nr:hypothetical protein CAPTEDRAFT_159406 [Capitella teleta]|eukprot:ELT89659.1 hypothetical protein CAPTEDRAFT_159406 [Capitella teleta]